MRGQQSRRPRGGRAGHRPLLTFRLDGERRQHVRARLAGEGRTMSEVIILGLELYVQHKLSVRSAAASEDPDAARPVESSPHAGQAACAADPAAPSGPADFPTPGPEAALQEDRAATPANGAIATGNGGIATGNGGIATASETTAVASMADLSLPSHLSTRLREMRESGQSDLLSATLARLYDVGWPLRPLAQAVGISRQAVQARIRQQVPAELRAQVPECPPPSSFPRSRPARAGRRRPHLTIKIDHALRAAAHREAGRNGHSLSQVVERILDHYLHSGLPANGAREAREIELGDTTPTRPARRSRT